MFAAGCDRHRQATPRYGTPVDATTLAALDIDVTPDGTGLPAGRGSVAQGETVYEARCAQCHESPVVPALSGGLGTLGRVPPEKSVGSYWPYATTLFDYINRAMPPAKPRSLSSSEVYALTAYVLSLSRIVKPGAVLDAATLPKIAMPNRNGFFPSDGKPDT